MKDQKQIANTDFTELLHGLDGKWVVLSENLKHVLGVSDSLESLDETVLKDGYVFKVPRLDVAFIPPIS